MAGPESIHPTRWTLVLRAQGRGEEARLAMSELCAIYYDPVLHFIRRCGWGGEDQARDLTHGFFEDLLARESPGAADPSKGRFRSYLFAAAKHWLLHHREKAATHKRGGQVEMVSLDEAQDLALTGESDHHFDRDWALALIRRAHAEVQSEMEASGRGRLFRVLQPWLDGGAKGDPAAAAGELDLSPTALKVAIHRLRERFRQKVRDHIAATIDDPSAVDLEFRHLVSVLVHTGA